MNLSAYCVDVWLLVNCISFVYILDMHTHAVSSWSYGMLCVSIIIVLATETYSFVCYKSDWPLKWQQLYTFYVDFCFRIVFCECDLAALHLIRITFNSKPVAYALIDSPNISIVYQIHEITKIFALVSYVISIFN